MAAAVVLEVGDFPFEQNSIGQVFVKDEFDQTRKLCDGIDFGPFGRFCGRGGLCGSGGFGF